MGWASGSCLMGEVIRVIKKEVPDDEQRRLIYKGLIKAFRNEDCDTLDECIGDDPAFDAAMRKRRLATP
jgi:hypothetical protein